MKDAGMTRLDKLDVLILSALQQEGRISNVKLASRVNLSPSPCLERVKRLEKAGFIESYGAKLNAAALGFGTSAFIQVTLDRTTRYGRLPWCVGPDSGFARRRSNTHLCGHRDRKARSWPTFGHLMMQCM